MAKSLNFIFLFVFILGFFCISQEKPEENIYDVLTESQRTDWYKARKAWEEKYFYVFLKKHKVKLSCASCSSVYVDAEFEVMFDGHAHVKVLNTKKCGSEFSVKQITELEKLLFNLEFSSELINKKFIGRIGNGLKC